MENTTTRREEEREREILALNIHTRLLQIVTFINGMHTNIHVKVCVQKIVYLK